MNSLGERKILMATKAKITMDELLANEDTKAIVLGDTIWRQTKGR